MMTLLIPGPRMATIPIANSNQGKASKMSVNRIKI
jgi:hypothetical protein